VREEPTRLFFFGGEGPWDSFTSRFLGLRVLRGILETKSITSSIFLTIVLFLEGEIGTWEILPFIFHPVLFSPTNKSGHISFLETAMVHSFSL
jgi:uncharacterized RDD family membrane protein YckC